MRNRINYAIGTPLLIEFRARAAVGPNGKMAGKSLIALYPRTRGVQGFGAATFAESIRNIGRVPRKGAGGSQILR